MSTALSALRILLSKEIGDFWTGTSTTPAAASTTSLTDTALMAKPNDWIDATSEMYDLITDADVNKDEERRISALDNSTGAITVLAHTSNNVADIDYEIHRLFNASDKRIALIDAAKSSYPDIFGEVRDESMVSGNWLKDGSFEIWTSDTELTHWTDDGTVILAKTSTSPYYKHGSYSCGLGTAAGYIHQDITNWDDLKHLAGKSVTFSAQGYCAVASTLRIAIYDGTTTTYSSHRTAEAAWTEHDDPMEVTATIQDNPPAIEFRIYIDTANTAYVDDARVMGPRHPRIYIGDLDLSDNIPHRVSVEQSNYSQAEPWIIIRGIDYNNGYMYLPQSVPRDLRLRIEGIGYLDFYDSSDVVGTDWEDTIAINSPQTEILVAQAAIYLLRTRALPTYSTGENQQALQALSFWGKELKERKARYGMNPPPAIVNYSSSFI